MKTPLIVALVGIALAACDRTHLSPNFGNANREAFRTQLIHPDAGNQVKPEQPLDPEEAATVAKTYQRSLAPASAQDPMGGGRSQILVVPAGPPGKGAAAPPQGTSP